MGSGTRSLFTVLALTFALLVAALVPAAGVAATKKPTTASALKALVRQTNKLPKSVTSVKKRNQLRLAAAHAQRSAKRSPCASVKDLARYRRVLRTVKVKSGKRFRKVAKQVATLQPASMTASRLLLANKKTKKLRRRHRAQPG